MSSLALAADDAAAEAPFAALPAALLLAVLALLPAVARMRCAAVCRAWRIAVVCGPYGVDRAQPVKY